MHTRTTQRSPSTTQRRILAAGLILICLAGAAAPVGAAQPVGPALQLVTEQVIVFKDGYSLVLKRGIAVTDEKGEVFTNEVPDAAVLGSFWATPVEGRLLSMVAGWTEVKETSEKLLPCTQVVHILKANVGKSCTVQLPDKAELTGVIREVLTQETSTAVPEALSSVMDPARSALRSNVPVSALPRSEGRTELLTDVTGTHFVLRTKEGDVLVPISDIRRLTVEDMRTVLPHKLQITERTKRLTFRFGEAGQRRELVIAYFRPGVRWIPTYRINLTTNPKQHKIAEISLQAELLNEAENLVDAPVDIVVGVPNFRFRTLPSPLILEQTLRNTLQQAAPQLMGQTNALSNAMFSQRAGEFHRPAAQAAPDAGAGGVELPAELTAASTQDLFVYHLPKQTIGNGERAAVPIFQAETPYRDVHTWSVHIARHDIAAAPSGAGVKSPLVLAENEVWRQVELVNNTNLPWTTGAAMIMQGQQPLAQELLTYTPPKSSTRVPVTVAIDVRGDFSEQETGRELKSLSWNGHEYAKIGQRATVRLRNYKSEPVEMEITVRFGGKAVESSDQGQISLAPYNADDWQQYRGDPAVNNSSTVRWTTTVKPGEVFQPTVDYYFFTRH